MIKATWDGTVIAEAEHTEKVEGNHYFPRASLRMEHFESSGAHSTCPWKGVSSYYTVVVNGKRNVDAAWYYPDPLSAARNIKDHVAFWKGIEVTEDESSVAE